MSARARQYIHMVVEFFTAHTNKPDYQIWVKIKRVLKYLKGMRKLKLALIICYFSVVKWWVDTSYAVQEYCRGHMGGMVSLGKVAGPISSAKQNINGKI